MLTPKRKKARRWDRHEIKARIARAGHTLKSLAVEHGLPEHAYRMSLQKPLPLYDLRLAAWLGEQPHVVWPDRYDAAGNRIIPIRKPSTGFNRNQSAKVAA